ncbi:MAG: trigger factor [Planctomycetota bacterium]|jgi:trigger factor
MAEATTTPDASGNEVQIEDVGPALKRVTITIPTEAVKEKIEESIGTLAQEASLPGFRRGRAPRRLLERRFGHTVRDETKNRLIADAYARAIEDHGIKPVSEPEPTEPPDKLKLEEGKPLSFAVDVEVVPEFELPELEGIQLKKPLLEITDEHIDDRIRRQQQRLGTVDRIDGDFREGDRMVGHVTLTAEGNQEPVLDADNALIVHPGTEDGGRGPVLGLMIEDLAGLLKGKRVSDTITMQTVGPEGHEREDIRGVNLTIEYRIMAAERTEPATVERLVEIFDLQNEENLREQMRLALQHQRDQEQAMAMREQVYDHLLKTVEMALPEKLSTAQAGRALEGRRIELLDRGMAAEEVETKLAEIRSDSESRSRDRLKLFFIAWKLGDHFKVSVSEQEVNGRVAAMAIEHGQRPDQLRAELARAGRLPEVGRMLRQEKSADRVIAKAKIEEISAAQWNRIMAGDEGAAGAKTKKKTTKKKTTKKKSASDEAAGAEKKKTRSKR